MIRLLLPWRGEEEKCFVTDISRHGIFLRTAIQVPVGTVISLRVPDEGPVSDAVRIDARVVRFVRRGDPRQPLGGMGLELVRLVAPRGGRSAHHALSMLFQSKAPRVRAGGDRALTLEFPSLLPGSVVGPAPAENVHEAAEPLPSRPVQISTEVFVRWNNMVVRGHLDRLGEAQAILTNMKVLPALGDVVLVRLLAMDEPRFRGLQFNATVDQLQTGASSRQAVLSLAIAADAEGQDSGSLRALIRHIADDLGPIGR